MIKKVVNFCYDTSVCSIFIITMLYVILVPATLYFGHMPLSIIRYHEPKFSYTAYVTIQLSLIFYLIFLQLLAIKANRGGKHTIILLVLVAFFGFVLLEVDNLFLTPKMDFDLNCTEFNKKHTEIPIKFEISNFKNFTKCNFPSSEVVTNTTNSTANSTYNDCCSTFKSMSETTYWLIHGLGLVTLMMGILSAFEALRLWRYNEATQNTTN